MLRGAKGKQSLPTLGKTRSGKEYTAFVEDLKTFRDRRIPTAALTAEATKDVYVKKDDSDSSCYPKRIRFSRHYKQFMPYVDVEKGADLELFDGYEHEGQNQDLVKNSAVIDWERVEEDRQKHFDTVLEGNVSTSVNVIPQAWQTDNYRKDCDIVTNHVQILKGADKLGFKKRQILRVNVDRATEKLNNPLYLKYLKKELKKEEYPFKYDRVHFKHSIKLGSKFTTVLAKSDKKAAGIDVWLVPELHGNGEDAFVMGYARHDERYEDTVELHLKWSVIQGYLSADTGAYPWIEICENSTNCEFFEVFPGIVDASYEGKICIKVRACKIGLIYTGFSRYQSDVPIFAFKICQLVIKGGNVDFERMMIEKGEKATEIANVDGYWVETSSLYFKMKESITRQYPIRSELLTELVPVPVFDVDRDKEAFRSVYKINHNIHMAGPDEGKQVVRRVTNFEFEKNLLTAIYANHGDKGWIVNMFNDEGKLDFDYELFELARYFEKLCGAPQGKMNREIKMVGSRWTTCDRDEESFNPGGLLYVRKIGIDRFNDFRENFAKFEAGGSTIETQKLFRLSDKRNESMRKALDASVCFLDPIINFFINLDGLSKTSLAHIYTVMLKDDKISTEMILRCLSDKDFREQTTVLWDKLQVALRCITLNGNDKIVHCKTLQKCCMFFHRLNEVSKQSYEAIGSYVFTKRMGVKITRGFRFWRNSSTEGEIILCDVVNTLPPGKYGSLGIQSIKSVCVFCHEHFVDCQCNKAYQRTMQHLFDWKTTEDETITDFLPTPPVDSDDEEFISNIDNAKNGKPIFESSKPIEISKPCQEAIMIVTLTQDSKVKTKPLKNKEEENYQKLLSAIEVEKRLTPWKSMMPKLPESPKPGSIHASFMKRPEVIAHLKKVETELKAVNKGLAWDGTLELEKEHDYIEIDEPIEVDEDTEDQTIELSGDVETNPGPGPPYQLTESEDEDESNNWKVAPTKKDSKKQEEPPRDEKNAAFLRSPNVVEHMKKIEVDENSLHKIMECFSHKLVERVNEQEAKKDQKLELSGDVEKNPGPNGQRMEEATEFFFNTGAEGYQEPQLTKEEEAEIFESDTLPASVEITDPTKKDSKKKDKKVQYGDGHFRASTDILTDSDDEPDYMTWKRKWQPPTKKDCKKQENDTEELKDHTETTLADEIKEKEKEEEEERPENPSAEWLCNHIVTADSWYHSDSHW